MSDAVEFEEFVDHERSPAVPTARGAELAVVAERLHDIREAALGMDDETLILLLNMTLLHLTQLGAQRRIH